MRRRRKIAVLAAWSKARGCAWCCTKHTACRLVVNSGAGTQCCDASGPGPRITRWDWCSAQGLAVSYVNQLVFQLSACLVNAITLKELVNERGRIFVGIRQ